jgi:hypothetical protein
MGLTGCSSVMVPGTTIVSYNRGATSDPQEAPSDGEYKLYSAFGENIPKHTVSLRKGDPVGFKSTGGGMVTAIGGDDEWTYTDASLIWKRMDD